MSYGETYDPPIHPLGKQARNLLDRRIQEIMTGVGQTVPTTHIQVVAVGAPKPGERLRAKLKREHDELVAAIGELSTQLAHRAEQLRELDRYPEEDPYGDDTVLRFKKAYPGNPDKLYTYAATKTEGLWYVTGDRSPNGVDWAALTAWMGLGVTEVYKIAPGRAAKVTW
jgi:hypothetical protein